MLKKIVHKLNLSIFMFLIFVMQVSAEIPTTSDFEKGAENKGGFDTLMYLFEKLVQLIILGVAAYFVVIIAKGAIKKYNDISDERATYFDLAGHLIGGIAVLTLMIIMLNWVNGWVG